MSHNAPLLVKYEAQDTMKLVPIQTCNNPKPDPFIKSISGHYPILATKTKLELIVLVTGDEVELKEIDMVNENEAPNEV